MLWSDAYYQTLREAAAELDARMPPLESRPFSRTFLCGARAAKSATQIVRDLLPTQEADAICIDEVCRRAGMFRQNATPILRGLVGQGLVRRVRRKPNPPRPGRAVSVFHYWRITTA